MGAASRLAELVMGTPLELSPELIERWPELAAVRWRRGGWPPRVPGWFFGSPHVAITLWHYVFLGPGFEPTAALLLHELRHVQQFESVRAFPVRYLVELVRRGYRRNRYEVDADAYAAARLQESALPL